MCGASANFSAKPQNTARARVRPAAMMKRLAVTAATNSSLSRMKARVAQICPATGAETAAASTHPLTPPTASSAPPMARNRATT